MTPDSLWVNSALVALGIFAGSFVSEDAALLSAASLASARVLSPVVALSSAALGICVGDLGLYGLARYFGPALSSKKWFAKRMTADKLARAQQFSQRWGIPALAASRFIPGSRLPMTVASGFLGMPLRKFAGVSALGSALWVLSVFGAVMTISARTSSVKLAFAMVAAVLLGSGVLATQWKRISAALGRWTRWEFWPAWLFYAPVAAMCLRLGVRYRGLALPTIANLNQKLGGMVGESKAEILAQLEATSPEMTARARLFEAGSLPQRIAVTRNAVAKNKFSFPFIFKPNLGQRGAGFRIVRNWDQVEDYLSRVTAPALLQEYAPGPLEAGIFYYRIPGETEGSIFAITDKIFPAVTGDGRSTVAELIDADPRARLIAGVYLKRLGAKAQNIPPSGEKVRLVEAGNHCQGCIFQDGKQLLSATLSQKIDQISQKLEGFYVGRYDVRYSSEEDLRDGRFTIIELNGASSEATSIYDARNSLSEAYAVLYRQWDLVYKIGAANRARGNKTASLGEVLREWLGYLKQSEKYPMAD